MAINTLATETLFQRTLDKLAVQEAVVYLLLNSVNKQVLTHIIDLNIKFIGLYAI